MQEVPIRDYAAIGDGRTVALVARDASVDWLCLPDLDSPSVFGALLDRGRAGRFALAPAVPYRATRRYVPGTNVLETTFTTGDGEARVVDAMALPASGLEPERALVRRVVAHRGRVPMRWSVDARFGYGLARTRVSRRSGVPVATSGSDALAVCAWDAGDIASCDGGVHGTFDATADRGATFALVAAHQEPLVLPGRGHAERVLPLTGYAGSRPVRIGNGAVGQLQLDVYGDLLQTAWRYARAEGALDGDVARRLARVADHVCDVWRSRDAGLWEVRSAPRHFTQSKMMCCIALERACALATGGLLPDRSAARWAREAAAIRVFVDGECWSSREQSYARAAGTDELDAGVLLGARLGYSPPDDTRMRSTVDAIRRRLCDGPFVRRYTGTDGLDGGEGAFLACSFWLVEALARDGRVDDATATMDVLVGLANDVGLYAEEVDPATEAFLGNFPQALTHLALISAAVAIDRASTR